MIRGVRRVHIVAFLAGHHLQRQLIVIAQENRPLAALRDVRRLLDDFNDGITILLGDRHVNARHQGEVIGHLALIAIAEVLPHIFRPLIGFSQQETVLIGVIDGCAQPLDDRVGFAQVLVVGALPFDEIRNGVEPKAVDSHVEPEPHNLEHRLNDLRIVEVQIRLMTEEAMPVVRLGHRIPGPIRSFRIGEDDARAEIFLIRVAPYIKIALRRARGRVARSLKPRMLIRGMVDDQFGDHLEAEAVRLLQHVAKIVERAELRMHVLVIGNVIAVVFERRGVEGHQPDGIDAQVPDVLELGSQTLEISNAIGIGVQK